MNRPQQSRRVDLPPESAVQDLIERAKSRMARGLAPPAEIYRIQYRSRINWALFPGWARPVDPDMFDGCCHEG